MDLHERCLSVLACRFVDEVIIGAPSRLFLCFVWYMCVYTFIVSQSYSYPICNLGCSIKIACWVLSILSTGNPLGRPEVSERQRRCAAAGDGGPAADIQHLARRARLGVRDGPQRRRRPALCDAPGWRCLQARIHRGIRMKADQHEKDCTCLAHHASCCISLHSPLGAVPL